MIYSAMAIANAFIRKALDGGISDLTPMKLQKLMFFAQSWYLKLCGETLFDGQFERWQYGPVIREIYYEFRDYGARNITDYGKDIWGDKPIIDDPSVLAFLDEILKTYGEYTGSQLSWITHQAETAWSRGKLGTVINQEDIKSGKV